MNNNRRKFLLSGAISLGVLLFAKFWPFYSPSKTTKGSIEGASLSLGHKLRFEDLPAPTNIIEQDVVIIGAGIAGLSAGYQLKKAGCNNFTLLELENKAGGNASHGENSVSAYPWGAHYVPLLSSESYEVRTLFEELGLIQGYDAQNLPIYNESYICCEPQSRLYIHGRWQGGILPSIGCTDSDEQEYKRFFRFVHDLKKQRGSDGRRLFAIPLDRSSQDRKWLKLDEITMQQWMQNEGYTSKYLLWYVNYCCRDDYGTNIDQTSAWAGLHYFAARDGVASNTEEGSILTWPEGNGWIANRLANAFKGNINTNALVYNIINNKSHVLVDYWDETQKQFIRLKARAIVAATPRFITARLLKSHSPSISAAGFSYSPWVVANLTLSKLPSGKGAPLSWDNVIYDSPHIGYVVATHQVLQGQALKTVVTYYWPLSDESPTQARANAKERTYEYWQTFILNELLRIHPELKGHVEEIAIWVHGHAMIRPTPGFIWGQARKSALAQHPPIFTAHSDMSGISIFEEAYTHGFNAAESVLAYLKHRKVSA